VHVLATSGKGRSPFLGDVPTFRQSGYDLQAAGWYGVFAPAKTPAPTVERLSKAIADAIYTPDVKDKVLKLQLEPTGTTAAEFSSIQKADAAFWAQAVKASGFKPIQ
jgi:tripartite-type tricarboxylate transporter receptor subunit TctC